MTVNVKNVADQKQILKRELGGEYIVPVTIASAAFTNGVCKAGNPIKADGTVANTAEAVGILYNDVYEENPNGALIKAFAVVNEANANANAEITLTSACKEALPLIVFE